MWRDRDDVTSFGPETIWFERFFHGTYTYSVYKFSGSGEITESSAHVEVMGSQGVIVSFDVPAFGSGRWWNVFTLDGTTGDITVINTISDKRSSDSSSRSSLILRFEMQFREC